MEICCIKATVAARSGRFIPCVEERFQLQQQQHPISITSSPAYTCADTSCFTENFPPFVLFLNAFSVTLKVLVPHEGKGIAPPNPI